MLVQKELKNAYIGEYKEWKPGENLLAYYPLTADVYDHKSDLGISGTTYNLSFTNGSSNISYGTNGLTATGKYLLRTNSIPSQTTYSTMLWCNRTSYTVNGSHGPLALTEKLSMFAYLDNSSPNIGAYSWGGDGYVSSGVTMSNGTWYHLAYTTDGSTLTIYINGQAYGPYNYRLGGTYNGLVVGGTYYGSNAQTFIGTLGEVYIWNRIITAQEVADYYNQTKANYGL